MTIDAPAPEAKLTKQAAELQFWRKEIERYGQWFRGELPLLYKTPSPQDHERVTASNEKDASILTWHKLHQEAKYLENLALPPDAFRDKKLLEVGSGPMPSATCFKDCRLYCLEPLLPEYLQVGFPLHYYDNVSFIHGFSENIPVEDSFFDAVISVNAIDHVDNIRETAGEIRRVLKPSGQLRMHVHYHSPKLCEPIELNDDVIQELFGWCGDLRRIGSSTTSFSADVRGQEQFVLWSNF
jgi:SAM-dependent methyltransferase